MTVKAVVKVKVVGDDTVWLSKERRYAKDGEVISVTAELAEILIQRGSGVTIIKEKQHGADNRRN